MKTSLPAIIASLTIAACANAAELQPNTIIPPFTGIARDYATTAKGAYAKENFQGEVTVTLKSGSGGNGCAFIGLGSGKPNPQAFGEPTAAPSLVFRMAPNDFGGGRVLATVDGQTMDEVYLGDGTHRLRFSWDATGRRAWLQIHRNWQPGASFAPDTSLFVPGVAATFGDGTRLFAGGAGGVQFADFSVKAIGADELTQFPRSEAFLKDASARTWLPVEGVSALTPGDTATAQVDAFLKSLRAHLRPVVCWYKGSSLEASRAMPAGRLELPNSKWEARIGTSAVADEPGAPETASDPTARSLTLSVTLKEGGAISAGIAAAVDFADWSPENYVLVPASVYNGNRNRIVNRGYAEGLDQQDYYRKDLPLTHGDVPHLSQEANKPSKLEVNSSNASTPAVVVFDKKAKRGFILLAEQAGRGGNGDFLRKPNGEIMDNAFSVEESADRSHASVVVGAPGVRAKKPEFIGFGGSPDRGIALKTGDTITLKLRVYNFAAADIPAVLEKFMTVRKALTGPNHPRNLLPESEHLKRMVGFTDGRFLSLDGGKAGFYMPENGDWIAFGWISGWMNTFQQLAQGDADRLDRVTKTFDFGLKGQRPSGYFWYSINSHGTCTRFPYRLEFNQSRTNGDVLYWMLKQFEMLRAQGRGAAVKPEWEVSMKKLADAFVATWKKDGQWGKFINVETGEVAEYNTTGGAMCISGLAIASDYFKKPDYLAVAKEAANFYYQRDFVKLGQTTGGCADILQNADAETAIGFATALMALYEATGDKEWLEKSRNAANLAATWVVSYDYELPKFTALGASGLKFAGAVWASTQNKHAAPGFCTTSADAFLKVYRGTGDTRYAEVIRDVLHAHADAIHGGGGTERLTYCDADSRGDNPGGANGWVVTDGAMMTLEIPGIYMQTDTDRFYVFDSVEARRNGNSITITNPTKFDAKVALFAESSRQSTMPQGYTAFLQWPRVEVKAGETRTITVSQNGTIQ